MIRIYTFLFNFENGNVRDTLCSKLEPILAPTSVKSKKKENIENA